MFVVKLPTAPLPASVRKERENAAKGSWAKSWSLRQEAAYMERYPWKYSPEAVSAVRQEATQLDHLAGWLQASIWS